jgi:hypothetical protein
MILGRFDRVSGRPTVDCHLTIRSLNIDGVVPFLVDTGADSTLLMPIDARRLKIPFEKLTNERVVYGLGGSAKVFYIPAVLIVSDKETAYAYRFALEIAEPNEDIDGMPSLIGRDIMKHWNMTLDFPEHKFSFKVQMCDEEMKL